MKIKDEVQQDTNILIGMIREASKVWIMEEINIKINEKLPLKIPEMQKETIKIIKSEEIQRWMTRFDLTEDDLKCL